MRYVAALVFVTAILALTLQAFADPAAFGDANIARPGGVYVSLTTPDAADCSHQCARDDICMAWTYRQIPTQSCELKAVVTPPVSEPGAYSGLSARAPEFTRHLADAVGPSLAQAQSAQESAPPTPQHASSEGLLGGPDETTLRPRLGQ